MAQVNPAPLLFPIKGLHEGVGYDFQPPATTSDSLNVRSFDILKNRLRGGRRPALSRFVQDAFGGATPVQSLSKVTSATGTSSVFESDTDTTWADLPASASAGTVDLHEPFVGFTLPSASAFKTTQYDSFSTDAAGRPRSGGSRGGGLAYTYNSTNDVTLGLKGLESVASATTATADEVVGIGPAIRISADLTTGVVALLRPISANVVRFEMGRYSNIAGTYTLLANGTANLTLNGTATTRDDLVITIREDVIADTIIATVSWPTQSDGSWASAANTSLTATETTLTGNKRAAAVWLNPATYNNTVGQRTLKSMFAILESPADPVIAYSLFGTTSTTPLPSTYFLPSGWSAGTLLTTGSFQSAQPVDGPVNTGSLPTHPVIDTSQQLLRCSPGAVTPRTAMVYRTTHDGVARDVALRFRVGNTSAVEDAPSPIFRLSTSDRTQFLQLHYTIRNIGGADGSSMASMGGFVLRTVNGGTATTLVSGDTNEEIVCREGQWIIFRDTGASVDVIINGVTVRSFDLTGHASDVAFLAGNTQSAYAMGAFTANSQTKLSDGFRLLGVASEDESFVSGISARLVAVVSGNVYSIQEQIATLVPGGTLLDTTPRWIASQQVFQDEFFVDGNSFVQYDLSENTVQLAVATVGDFPVGSRLLALYRGRLVHAGVAADPNNYFMSRSGEPLNYDYVPADPDGLEAVAGNNSPAGLVGDVITALITFDDDAMIFGGDHSIYQMTGDPAAGGVVDMLTDKTGIAFGKAWAKDPSNILYFWGTDGIYRYALGGKMENITKGRIDVRLRAVDLTRNYIVLEWDYLRAGLVVNIMPIDTSLPNQVLFWDSRADAWSPDSYPTDIGPTVMLAYDGPLPADQALLFGGRNGIIYWVDENASDDDGEPITSRVRFAPYIAPNHASEVKINSILPILANGSGQVNVDVYTGQSAEDCALATSPRIRRLLSHAGRNASMRQKVRGYAIQVALSHTGSSRWALEGLTVGFEQGGMPRKEVTPNAG